MAISRTLQTERLRLCPFSPEFLTERYVAWLNDPEVVRHSEQRFRTHTLASCQEYMLGFENSPDYFWAISSDVAGEGHIGNTNACVDPCNGVADVAILIGEKKVWGRGYGSEAFLAVVDFLFREVRMRKVTAGTMAVNAGMIGVMKRLGMEPDGRRLRQFVFEGEEVDVVHCALFRDTWLATTGDLFLGARDVRNTETDV